MFDVNKAIYACDDVICRNIDLLLLSKEVYCHKTYYLNYVIL